MHILGVIPAVFSVVSIAFLQDDFPGPGTTSVFFPAISPSVLSPANLVKRMDPPRFPPEAWPSMCQGNQYYKAIQLAAFKTHTNSPYPPLGPSNTQSRFHSYRSINSYWTTRWNARCDDLDRLEIVLRDLIGAGGNARIPPVTRHTFHTWTLRVG